VSDVPQLIGLTGYAQHGKNTVADILTEEYGYKQLAFAQAVKDMAYVLDPFVPIAHFDIENPPYTSDKPAFLMRLQELVDIRGWDKAKQLPEVRRLLQTLGTEAVRDMIGPDTWVNLLQDKAATLLLEGARVVVTDVRFPNEGVMLRTLGGQVWYILRPDFDNGIGKDHPSEAQVQNVFHEVTIRNDGTIDELRHNLKNFFRALSYG